MRTLIFLSLTFLFCNYSFAQGLKTKKEIKGKDDNQLEDKRNKNLVSNEAFDEMIRQDVIYAIIGESNPTSGIKLDISKPEGTISIFSEILKKKEPFYLLGFDLKGGVTDENFNILKGTNSFNTAFEFKPSLHVIPHCNSAKYKENGEKKIIAAKIDLLYKDFESQTDTFRMVTLIYNHHLENLETTVTSPIITDSLSDTRKQILISLVKKFSPNTTNELTIDSPDILKSINQVSVTDGKIDIKTYNDEIVNTYQKYKKLYNKSDERRANKELSIASDTWTMKHFRWFTFSPFASTEKLNLYHTKYNEIDSSYFKQKYQAYYGIDLFANRLIHKPNKVLHYMKAGVSFSHSNNITSLNSFNYETRSSLFNSSNSSVEKTKTGIAYNKNELKSDFLRQLKLEYYLLPLKSRLPGLYISTSFNRSDLYKLENIVDRENDKTQISTEGGLIFNINSREKGKEKDILSLSIYARNEDITDSRRTSIDANELESRNDHLRRNLSFGIKVGVPITLPKRANK